MRFQTALLSLEAPKDLHCALTVHSEDPLMFLFSVTDLSQHVSLIKRHPQPHVHSTDRTVLTVSRCAIPSFTRHLCNSSCYVTLPMLAGPSGRPRGLRRRSGAARLLTLWVRIPPGAWMSVCFESCVLSGTGLCDELITRSEESYRLRCENEEALVHWRLSRQ